MYTTQVISWSRACITLSFLGLHPITEVLTLSLNCVGRSAPCTSYHLVCLSCCSKDAICGTNLIISIVTSVANQTGMGVDFTVELGLLLFKGDKGCVEGLLKTMASLAGTRALMSLSFVSKLMRDVLRVSSTVWRHWLALGP